jgi:2-polyprenyl-3-methyl-5-hydroxy-6-metoxy-1,4-benzoquinol methylase
MVTNHLMLTEIPCVFCQQYRERVVIRENGYQGVKCDLCGLVYISPRPIWRDILALYLKTGEKENLQEAKKAGGFHNLVRSLPARHTLAIVKKYRPAGSLLELGPGTGEFLTTAQTAGFEVSGLEVNQKRAEFISHSLGIPCDSTPLSSSSQFGKKFDIVYMRDVLSHFYDPIAQFHLVHTLIKENGLLVFETGNLGEADEKYFNTVPTFDYPEHLFFYGKRSLQLLLEVTGFELLIVRRYSITFVSILEKIVHHLKKKKSMDNTSEKSLTAEDSGRTKHSGLKHRLKKFLWLSYDFFVEYFFKYQLGRCLPKHGRPQTLIVLARKI